MKFTRSLLVACAFVFCAGSTASNRIEIITQRHDQAIASASDAYWKARAAADKQEQSQLQTMLKDLDSSSPDRAMVSEELKGVMASMREDAGAITQHTPIMTEADFVAKQTQAIAAVKAQFPDATPEIISAIYAHRLVVGMTLEEANKSMGIIGKQTAADESSSTYEWPITTKRLERPRLAGSGADSAMESDDPSGSTERYQETHMISVTVRTGTMQAVFSSNKITFFRQL